MICPWNLYNDAKLNEEHHGIFSGHETQEEGRLTPQYYQERQWPFLDVPSATILWCAFECACALSVQQLESLTDGLNRAESQMKQQNRKSQLNLKMQKTSFNGNANPKQPKNDCSSHHTWPKQQSKWLADNNKQDAHHTTSNKNELLGEQPFDHDYWLTDLQEYIGELDLQQTIKHFKAFGASAMEHHPMKHCGTKQDMLSK